MTTIDMQAARQRLEAERASLVTDIESLDESTQNPEENDGASNHVADEGTDVFLIERDLTLRENTNDMLEQVDAALKRIDDGTYGTCVRCGKPINPERLEALPAAAYCITCQAEIEQEAR